MRRPYCAAGGAVRLLGATGCSLLPVLRCEHGRWSADRLRFGRMWDAFIRFVQVGPGRKPLGLFGLLSGKSLSNISSLLARTASFMYVWKTNEQWRGLPSNVGCESFANGLTTFEDKRVVYQRHLQLLRLRCWGSLYPWSSIHYRVRFPQSLKKMWKCNLNLLWITFRCSMCTSLIINSIAL